MSRLRFRRRTLVIGITLLIPVIAALAFGLLLWWQLHNAYGPGGILDPEYKRWNRDRQKAELAFSAHEASDSAPVTRSAP